MHVSQTAPLADDPPTTSRAERVFVAANRGVLVLLLAAMAALVITNVISRYAFGHSFPWVEEVSRYLMIWAAFFGLGPALRVGGHIAVETLPNSLPRAGARALRGLLVLVMGAALAYLVWLGVEYARFGWEQETPVLGWSIGQVYLAIPIGAALALVHLALAGPRWVMRGAWETLEDFDAAAL